MAYFFVQGNIVIDGSGRALLCDFGLSRIRHDVTRTYTCIRSGGRQLFLPPELSEQREGRPNEAGDVYAFAMTMLRLGTGEDPFEGVYRNVYDAVREAQLGSRPPQPKGLGGLPDASFNTLWSLMERMWAHNPAERPTASEVVRVTKQLVAATSHSESPLQISEGRDSAAGPST